MALERRFTTGQYGSVYQTPPTIVQQMPRLADIQEEARRTQTSRPTSYNVQDIQSQEGVGVTPGATPTEQRAGGATEYIQNYDDPTEDFIRGLRIFTGTEESQIGNRPGIDLRPNQPANPQDVSQTVGMPFNYSDYEPWQITREMSGNQQTFTTGGVGSADQEAAMNQFMMWGQTGDPNMRPGYITPLTQQIFGLTEQDMVDIGYIQDGAGGWVRVNLGDTSLTGEGYYGGGGGGGYGGGGYSVPSTFRSGYASGLINWRIGL
jgi:hypothetical protein